jgi:hypothetical protein
MAQDCAVPGRLDCLGLYSRGRILLGPPPAAATLGGRNEVGPLGPQDREPLAKSRLTYCFIVNIPLLLNQTKHLNDRLRSPNYVNEHLIGVVREKCAGGNFRALVTNRRR